MPKCGTKLDMFLNFPMKKVTQSLLALLLAALPVTGFAAAADVLFSQKNSSNTAWANVIVAPTASSALAFNSSKVPISTQALTLSSVTSPAGTNLTLGLGTGGTALTLADTTLAATFAGAVSVSGTITPSGSVHGANGSAANPSFAFLSNQNTGLYRIGANNIGVAANGAKVLDIATTGLTVTGALGASSLTSPAGIDLTLAGGSSGASLVLGQGATAANVSLNATTSGFLSFTKSEDSITPSLARLLNAGATTAGRYNEIIFGKSLGNGGAGTMGYKSDTATPANSRLFFVHYGNNQDTGGINLTNTGNLLIGGTTDISGTGGLKIFGSTAGSAGAGALVVTGGLSAGAASYFGGAVNVAGVLYGAGTNTWALQSVGASGALVAGGWLYGINNGFNITPNGAGVAGATLMLAAFDGTGYREMLSTANVASGASTLRLAGYGGPTTVGGTLGVAGTATFSRDNSTGLAAISLPNDESSIAGPSANTFIKMGGNLNLSANSQWAALTAGVNRLTITSAGAATFSGAVTAAGGTVTVGTTTNGKLNLYESFSSAGASGIDIQHVTGSAAGTFYAAFEYGTGVLGSITQFSTTGVLYNTASDYRLKDITGPLTNSGTFIDSLKPKTGTWKTDGSKFVGFLAHEFAEVCPSAVTGEKDAVDSDGKPIYQAMQASAPEVMANLVAEIQSLRKRLAALEAAK